jgi:inosose dehydratase
VRLDRVAGAPISWGVCEAPGWGLQLAPDRVLAEMGELGLRATERGPDGWLPDDPGALRDLLARHGLRLVAGFVPAVLHREPDGRALEGVARAAATLAGAGADVLVLAADGEDAGYDRPAELDAGQWRTLLANLRRVQPLAADHGLVAALHPHAGTAIERRHQVERLLADSEVALCLDTGHLVLGGTDPVALARSAPERIAHVHLKDVDLALAGRVTEGGLPFAQAVRQGVFRPLGRGGVDLAALVALLDAAGYDGWYVLEQDVMLEREPPPGQGPAADVKASIEALRSLAAREPA